MDNWVYLVLLLVAGFLMVLHELTRNKAFHKVLAFVLVVFSGIRHDVGTDYRSYVEIFRNVHIRGRYYGIEWGYYYLMRFVSWLNGTQQLVFLIMATATIIFIYKYIDGLSSNRNLSWLLYLCIGPYYLGSFNGVRQALSIAIFAYSLKYANKEDYWRFAFLNICGSLFHTSALLMLALYFILTKTRLTMVKAFCVLLVYTAVYSTGLVAIAMSKLGYGSYTSRGHLEMDLSYIVFVLIALCIWLILLLIRDMDRDYLVFKNLNFLSLIAILAAYISPGISNIAFTRFNTYFFITYVVLVPYIISKLKGTKIRTTAMLVVVVVSISYYFWVTSTASDLLPYQVNLGFFAN
jgi:hypothetical protein